MDMVTVGVREYSTESTRLVLGVSIRGVFVLFESLGRSLDRVITDHRIAKPVT